MRLRHDHMWQETSRRFNPPCGYQNITARADVDGYALVREMNHGITVVELACKVCGDVKAVRYVGDSGARPG